MANILHSLSLTEADARMIPIATVLFFMLYGVLSRLLFQPLLALITEREEKTIGFEDASVDLKERAQEIRNRVEVKASLAEGEFQKERRDMLEKARKEAAEILGKAEQSAADMIKQGRVETDSQCSRLREIGASSVGELAQLAADRILEPSADYRQLH